MGIHWGIPSGDPLKDPHTPHVDPLVDPLDTLAPIWRLFVLFGPTSSLASPHLNLLGISWMIAGFDLSHFVYVDVGRPLFRLILFLLFETHTILLLKASMTSYRRRCVLGGGGGGNLGA